MMSIFFKFFFLFLGLFVDWFCWVWGMFLKLFNWRKYRRILKKECLNLLRFFCIVLFLNIFICLFWLKMFLYICLLLNKKILLLFVMEFCVNLSIFSIVYWVLVFIGFIRYGILNSWRSFWGRGEKIIFVVYFCNFLGGEGGKCYFISEYKIFGKGR